MSKPLDEDEAQQELLASIAKRRLNQYQVAELARDREKVRRDVAWYERKDDSTPLIPRLAQNLVAAGAGVAGAAVEAGKNTIEAAHYAGKKFVEDPFHPVTRENAALWPDTPEEKKRLVQRANEAEAAAKAQNAEREALSMPERVARNVTDLTTGGAQLATNLVGKDRQEPIMDTVTGSFQTGKEALVPAAKGIVNTITHPELYPADAALNGLPLIGAGRSALAAGGLKLAERGGTAAKVGEALHAVAKPGSLTQGVASVAERLHILPGAEKLAERLKQFVDTGRMTADEAAKLMEETTPWQQFTKYHGLPEATPTVKAAGSAAKGAAYGALLGGGSPAAIGLGAALGGGSHLLSPAVRAWAKRWMVDANAQDTTQRTARVSQMLDEAANIRSAVQESGEEAASEYGAGRVDWHPDLASRSKAKRMSAQAPVPPGFKEVRRIDPATGRLELTDDAGAARAELSHQAQMLERAPDVNADLVKTGALTEEDAAAINDVDREQLRALKHGNAVTPVQMAPPVHAGLVLDRPALIDRRMPAPMPDNVPAATTVQRGLDIASGVAEKTPKMHVPAKTNNPRVEAAIDRIHEIANSGRRAEDEIPRHWFARTMTDALRTQGRAGMSLLLSPRGRGAVIEAIVNDANLSKSAARQFRKSLGEQITKYEGEYFGPTGNAEKGLVIEYPKGDGYVRRDLQDVVSETMLKSPKIHNAIQEEAVSRAAMQVGTQASDEFLVNELKKELHGFDPTIAAGGETAQTSNVSTYADSLLQHVEQNGHVPLMNPHGGEAVALELVRKIRTGELSPTAERAAREAVKAFEKQKPASGAFGRFLQEKGIHGAHVDPGFAQTMEAPMQAREMAKTAMGLWDAFKAREPLEAARAMTRNVKIGQTAGNLGSWFHNFASNAIVTSLFTGDPAAALQDAYKAWKQHAEFRKVGGTGPEAMKWRAASRNGMGNAGNLDGELASAFGQSRGIARDPMQAGANLMRGAEGLSQAARSGYQTTGDMAWKLAKFSNSFDATAEQLAKLADGKYLALEQPHGAAIRVTKVGDKFEALGKLYDPESQQFADLIGRSAVKDATDLYFHGSRQPLIIQHLRMASGAGVASPFVTWLWNAVDLPGKPGLLSRVLQAGLNIAETNDPAIHMQNAMKFAKLAAKRTALTSFLQEQVDPRLDAVRRANAWHPANQAIGVAPSNHKGVANVWDWTPMDPFAATEMVMAGGMRLAHVFTGAPTHDEVASLDPHTRARVKLWARMESGKEMGTGDWRSLMLLSGGPLMHLLENTEKPFATKMADFVGSMLGVTPTRALQFALEPSPLRPGKDAPTREDAFEHGVKMLLDVGVRPVLLTGDDGRAQKQINAISRALKEGLVRPQEKLQETEKRAARADGLDEFAEHKVKAREAKLAARSAQKLVDKVVHQWTKEFNKGWKVMNPKSAGVVEPTDEEEPAETDALPADDESSGDVMTEAQKVLNKP